MMRGTPGDLEDYYREQMDRLRDGAATFGRDHPGLARELGLSEGQAGDPHVELLMQSFAYLSGRLRYQADAERDRIPNGLFDQLYPHLAAPVPASGVLQLDVKADGGNFELGAELERGREFSTTMNDNDGGSTAVRFRTTCDTPLWPLQVTDISMAPPDRYDFLRHASGVGAVLRVQLECTGGDPAHALPLDRLRFHLPGGDIGYTLYDQFAGHLQGIAVRVPGRERVARLAPDALHWCGFGDDEAALPAGPGTHPGYRLLQEYFALPEKFLFFEVQGLDLTGADDRFEILFLLGDAAARHLTPGDRALRVNCVPVVNLFRQPLEPVRFDRRRFEYRVSADWAGHRHCEVHSIERLHAIDGDGRVRAVEPLSGGRGPRRRRAELVHASRREPTGQASIAGTELYLSILDRHLQPDTALVESVGGEVLCTNRDLPHWLCDGDRLRLDGPGPVEHSRLIGRPSPHRSPRLVGDQPWALVSQLSLNYLALTDGPDGLARLQSMLRAHCDEADETRVGQIDALRGLAARPTAHYAGTQYWRGCCRGTAIDLTIDESLIQRGSALLFGSVLRRFFALFGHVNHLTELVLHSRRSNEVRKRWAPLAGNEGLL